MFGCWLTTMYSVSATVSMRVEREPAEHADAHRGKQRGRELAGEQTDELHHQS